ncbi:carbamate kinase [Weissella confusa]|jgi:carbamate kinase|uniref:carbamate kinase n=1 Tax=Weissella confusa TaxID=1583 RepID=UPI000989A1F5|nr:carbamate kinase [Weissella confusa]MBJ7647615.1 carbamate kinase [Weissella confusa]MBJ7648916.1 carbamate kinase [Weissella confusa]MBJ7660052.1 carbamate kinase [Weissella confusa]MBJ7661277.1 carbamate kinase [Weissella confusa]MBJ7680329.1 carbamate kinase [Weissella confusa]
MTKRIVVALGGNAILTDDPSAEAQQTALQQTAKYLVNFLEMGDVQLVLTHGNGPQVGNLVLQQLDGSSAKNPAMPLDTVGAMTQGEIGLWLADALNEEIISRGLDQKVATVLTRTVVDANDAAFEQPTKPIGPFYTAEEAKTVRDEHPDWTIVEDAGRGYRRVVPSPKPISIMEADAIRTLAQEGVTLIAAGGGGVPVVRKDNDITGVEAVIDKDFTAAKLAELVDADELVILTAVQYVTKDFKKPTQEDIKQATVAEMQALVDEGQFPAGSMKPKVEAAMSFVTATGRNAVITSLDNIAAYLENGDGTVITA